MQFDARPDAAMASAAGNSSGSASRAQAADGACPACGGRTERQSVMIALWEVDTFALVRDVPAVVCESCHERYFEDDVAMRLDLMRAGGFAAHEPSEYLSVPVYAFAVPAKGARK